MTTTCKVCGAELLEPKATGRPPTYCSTGCRRAAEYDVRRCNDVITQLEGRARYLRDPGRIQDANEAAEAEFLATEIGEARRRLSELLNDDERDENA